MRPRSRCLTSALSSILCLSVSLSPSLGFSATQQQHRRNGVLDDIALPTPADERLEAWYAQQGLLGTDRVKIRTTPRSVAGRGLFYSSERPAEQGDLLAFIPARYILTKETAKRQWTDLQLVKEEDASAVVKEDWPVTLTACASRALHDDEHVAWSQWIETWQGPSAPSPPSSLTSNEIQNLAMQTQSSPTEINKALQVRYDVFQRHCARLEESYGCAKSNVGDLYGIVLSRSATLGPDWNYDSGIIPLHDMLNHPPRDQTPSVELFSIGEIASLTSREHVERLAKSNFSLTNLQDRDLALVARQTIHPGEELFLSYTKRELLSNEQARVWKTLQYGFCPE